MKDSEHPISAADKAAAVEALRTLEKTRTGIVLTGVVKNGKVVLDPASLEAVARKFPAAEISFIAVNAPFDPQSRPVGEASS